MRRFALPSWRWVVPVLLAGQAVPVFAANTYVSGSTAVINLPLAGQTAVTIASVTVPAGKWIAQANATVANYSVILDVFHCGLSVDGVAIVANAADVGSFTTSGTFASTITVQLARVTTRPATFALYCNHDQSFRPGVPLPLVDPGATLIVRPVAGGLVFQ